MKKYDILINDEQRQILTKALAMATFTDNVDRLEAQMLYDMLAHDLIAYDETLPPKERVMNSFID